MLKRLLIIMVTLVVTFFYADYTKTSFEGQLEAVSSDSGEVLDDLPNVAFKDLSLGVINLSEKAGELPYFAVHFWATWCAPCEAEFPEFLKLAKQNLSKMKFYLVAVNDELPKVKRFIKKYSTFLENPEIEVLIDNDKEFYSKFGTAKVPETYIFNTKTKKLIRKYTGPQAWERENYGRYFRNL